LTAKQSKFKRRSHAILSKTRKKKRMKKKIRDIEEF